MHWGLKALAILAAAFAGLTACAGGDAAYTARVLVRQDAGTEDYLWKASAPVAASARPSTLRMAPDPAAVKAAFEADEDCADLETYLEEGGALALLVYQDGALRYEWYGNGGAADRPAAAFSLSKSVVSLLLARAVAAGQLPGLDVPITDYVPDLTRRDPRFADITLRQLLDMRSGIGFDATASFPWVNQDAPAVYYASDLARTVVRRPKIVSAPGVFVYNDYAPNLNGLALQAATGSALAEGPMQALWNDLGAEYPAAWSVDSKGFAWHESGLVVTARDLVRFSRLLLEDGQADGRPVAPPAWLADSLTPRGEGPATRFGPYDMWYRNGWWARPRADGSDDIIGMGNFGQIMLVSPADGILIVRMGQDGHAETNVALAERFRRVADRLAAPPAP
jgi:CubicO group peptidase (beta-lactamase class C family)